MIPHFSAPLVKDIRTGEGILEWALALIALLAGLTGNLSISHTVTYATVLAISKGVRRGLVKLVALQKQAGIGQPLEPAVLVSASSSVEQVLAEIAAAQAAAQHIQSEPGTPAQSVAAGLSPDAVKP